MDGLGNPIRLILTGGEAADVSQAISLLEGFDVEAVIADKAYDADYVVENIESRGAQAVIPPRSNRKELRSYDKHLYKERNLVERFFNKLKHFRRVATRYEKTARNYLAMVTFAATIILMA